jgi:WD40 repeat protein/serine/threonine protein kinase
MAATESADACPSRHKLEAFRVGDLSLADLERVAEHLAGCPGCASALDALPDTPDPVVSALRDLGSDPVPSGGTLNQEVAALEAACQDPSWYLNVPPADAVPGPGCLREYRLLGKLSEGGMGAVYRALHTRLDRVVALKVLPPHRTANPDAVARFRREMKAVGKLSHPHIVEATDAGEVDGTHFLVMEYVAGPDLARLVRAVGRLPVADACEAARQAAVGLHHAHQRGLVHRDVKPSNLLLTRAGQVKVLDLGLALLPRGDTDGSSSSERAVLGTLDYLAPEQAERAHAVDRRADLYGLGCTLFHLLTGSVPYPAPAYETPVQKMYAHARAPVPSVRAARPEVPEKLAALLGRLLAKDPASRPASAAEVADALRPFADGSDLAALAGRVALPGGASADAATIAPSLTPPSTQFTGPPRRRPYRLVLLAAGLLGLAALAGAVVYVQTSRGTLEVETDDDDVRVHVDRGGNVVTILDLKSRKQVQLRAGTYHVGVEGRDDLVVAEGDALDLRRGGRVVARIRRKGWDLFPAVAVTPPDPAALARRPCPADALRQEDIPEAVRAALGGGNADRVASMLVAVLGPLQMRHRTEALTVALSPDGNTLASAGGTWNAADRPGEVYLWDARHGTRLHTLTGHGGAVLGVAFSPDGTRLATASLDRTVRLWDVATGKELQQLPHAHWVRSVAFSPDGKFLASGGGEEERPGAIKVWDAASGKERFSLAGHAGPVARVAFSPDGTRLASASWDRTVVIWDVEGRKPVRTLPGCEHWVQDAAWSPDGRRVAAGGYDHRVRAWEVATGEEVFKATQTQVCPGVAYSPDGGLLAGACWDGIVRLWDARTGAAGASAPGHVPRNGTGSDKGVSAVAWARAGRRLVSGGWDGRVRVWDVLPSGGLVPAGGHGDPVEALAVSPDGKLAASGGEDATVRLWDLAGGKEVAVLTGHTGPVHGVAFGPDGKLLASAGGDHRIKLWDVAARQEVRTLEARADSVEAVAFHPAGKVLASGAADGTVVLWNVATGEQVRALRHPRRVAGVAFSPDGRVLATACEDGIVRLWDPAAGARRAELRGHGGAVNQVAFGPDGKRLASAGADHTVRLWDVGTAEEVRVLRGHDESLHGVAFAADGRRLASCGAGGRVQVWNLEAEPPLRRRFTIAPGQGVHAVAFTPEGGHLLTTSPDGTVFVFRLLPRAGPPPK